MDDASGLLLTLPFMVIERKETRGKKKNVFHNAALFVWISHDDPEGLAVWIGGDLAGA